MPRVSVVTIFLNAGRFLEETLASLAAQTIGDWELVLVDDGSTDASSAIARGAAEASGGRIRYVDHDGHRNLGLAASRNRGLAEARGDYVLYLDSDDILFPDALAALADALDADEGIALASAATLFWNWDPAFADEPDQMQDYRHWADRTVDGKAFLAAMIADERLHPANCSTMIRRRALLDIGGFDPAFSGIYEDTSLVTELLVAHRVAILRRCLSAYRMHATSHCHTAISDGDFATGRPNAARIRYLDWARDYLAGQGLATSLVGRTVDRVLADQRRASLSRKGVAPARFAALLRDPARILGKLRARVASTDEALATLEHFYRGRGETAEVARLVARRAALSVARGEG